MPTDSGSVGGDCKTPHLGGGRHGAELLDDQRRDGETSLWVRTETGLRHADGLHFDGVALLHERREAQCVASGRKTCITNGVQTPLSGTIAVRGGETSMAMKTAAGLSLAMTFTSTTVPCHTSAARRRVGSGQKRAPHAWAVPATA